MFTRKSRQETDGDTLRVCSPDTEDVCTTVIGTGAAVEGNILAGTGAEVYGLFTGDISLQEGTARVMPGGRVKGNVRAASIVIGGVVEGSCEGRSVTILEQGVLKGKCCSAEFSIKPGGGFTGTSEAWPETEADRTKEEHPDGPHIAGSMPQPQPELMINGESDR
ncbi:polymer-forming cytoskeletal protein [Salmonella enterica]|nr:polymer-forming cytoskeletal protein [Salmonella enterica]ECO1045198.1 polymer-forming cytoskeletal protein [Salmonella enterica subsp. enterica serovar Newport]EDR8676181.1 polymer-forming cytoskeletal protein [Salmonella enterica]